MIELPSPTGILLIDKPLGPTSMDVCRVVKRALRGAGAPKRVKVGHGGTLDPLASGLLVVLIGKATKLCDVIMSGAKGYVAEVDLSCSTTTDDREGERAGKSGSQAGDEEAQRRISGLAGEPAGDQATHPEIRPRAASSSAYDGGGSVPSLAQVDAACERFVGVIQQRPPAFSAMKIGGQRAYKLARQGQEVEIAARPVRIDAIRVLGYQWPIAKIEVECGKGTYIRSLARDLGEALGRGGHLASLRRTRIGRFSVEQATTLDALPGRLTQEHLLPIPVDLMAGGEH